MTISLDKPKKIDLHWYSASWGDYEKLRDDEMVEHQQLFFYNNQLLVENMPGEGLPHSRTSDLLRGILFYWFAQHPETNGEMVSKCSPERQGRLAAVPDIALYVGDGIPVYQSGGTRRINLEQERPPNLVIEVADTTLVSDLDQKKHLYEEMGIPEYWVVDVKGERDFAFILTENGSYDQIETSQVLPGLPIGILDQTVEKLSISNIAAAAWFSQQIATQQSTTEESQS